MHTSLRTPSLKAQYDTETREQRVQRFSRLKGAQKLDSLRNGQNAGMVASPAYLSIRDVNEVANACYKDFAFLGSFL